MAPPTIKTEEEIEILRECGRRLAIILNTLSEAVKPGGNAYELNVLAENLIFESGGEPAFKGYRSPKDPKPFPAAICVSVNEELVHALPEKDKIFKRGDIVGLDIGMKWPSKRFGGKSPGAKILRPLYSDTAVTVGVGEISPEAVRLLKGTKEALEVGINTVRKGTRVGDIGHAVEMHLKKYGLGVVKNLAGHGVGYEVHEEPLVPNYGIIGGGLEFKDGMVLAIEPMATLGNGEVELAADGWTFKTKDGSLAAHFEHTVVVTQKGAEILTKI